jgi:biotin carboxyl carrier protein
MKWHVVVDGRAAELELFGRGERWRFCYRGREREASAIEVEPNIYSVLIDGRSYEVTVVDSAVEIRGRRFTVDVRDPRRFTGASSPAAGQGQVSIAALMPGKVVRVMVAEGDTVEAGQGLVVVEAMKMQNEMKAPKPGRVARLPARAGATVAAGEVLAVIQ